ncbi:polysaccharide deacetylase family protein [Pelagibacteraceae bacterium]|nr:polysaccharide deacetylase family protein [Pelagibacteraceae bacterium]
MSKKRKFYHGIMFHHFHDGNIYKKGQGSIDKNDFYKLIKFIGRKNVLNADQFFIRYKENKLTSKNVCFTFDDSLKCQYHIALPVLEDFNIKSFFFIHSSIFKKKPVYLELFRHFRLNYYKNINLFYDSFFKYVNADLPKFFSETKSLINIKKRKFPIYSLNDIKFRLVRDELLDVKTYEKIMFKMFKSKNFKPKKSYDSLFLNKDNLLEIKKLGHLIGLHSHSHPMIMEKLTYTEQKQEYQKNINILSKVLDCDKKELKYMAHPSGSYNNNTLQILTNFGIELGFKQIMTVEYEKSMQKINNSFLEVARQDQADIMKMIR